MSGERVVFVFGSNLAGRHGKGAALEARNNYGAVYGIGRGRTGNSYALPTKDEKLDPLILGKIEENVTEFLDYARDHPNVVFKVTKVGCGLAGYKESDIKPFFSGAPLNCDLPEGWRT